MRYRLPLYTYIFIAVKLLVSPWQFIHAQAMMDPVFSQFYAAPVYLNPAFAGSTLCSRIALSQRLISGPENFYTANFSYDRYIEALNGGIGLMVTSDQTNMYMMRNSINAIYAYHLRVTDGLSINFGLQAGYIGNYSNWNRFVFPDPAETEPDHTWKNAVDFAAGLLFFSDVIYGGVSVHHLNEPNMSLFDDGSAPLHRKYTAHIGFYTEPARRQIGVRDAPVYFFSPNFVFQLQGELNEDNFFSHTSFGFYAGRKPIMLGIWYRLWIETGGAGSNNAFVFLAGINFDDYRIAYSYDRSDASGIIFNGIHEVSVVFRFNCPQRNIGGRIINHP